MGNRSFVWIAAILLTLPFVAGAQTMVPSQNGVCLSGSGFSISKGKKIGFGMPLTVSAQR